MGGPAGIDPLDREEQQRCTECGAIISTLYETCNQCYLIDQAMQWPNEEGDKK